MSEHVVPPSPPHDVPSPRPSSAMPISIIVALAMEVAFVVSRFVLPASWFSSDKYWLVSSGIYTAASLLLAMGLGDLIRRLPPHQASGAQMAMVANAAFVVLGLASSVVSYATIAFSEKAELIWSVQGYIHLGLFLTAAGGLIIAAGGFARVAGPAIALVVLAVFLAPPPFLAMRIYDFLGSSNRYVYPLVGLGHLGLQAYLIREAARSSTRDLPAEPTAPFALLGTALRARVIAMLVLVLFTLFAMGGKSVGAMKFAMVAAPSINMIAFIVFGMAALRAGRGLDDKVQVAFALAGTAAAWCAGVLAVQTPAIYQMLAGGESYSRAQNNEIVQAFAIAMPLIATIGVVVALLAVGAHVRQLGHADVAASIAPRTTTFVVLMLMSVFLQYVVPKASSIGELLALGFLAAGAGVTALLVAAGVFKRASEATSTNALPTATVLPPS